jgi:hypothetical protein
MSFIKKLFGGKQTTRVNMISPSIRAITATPDQVANSLLMISGTLPIHKAAVDGKLELLNSKIKANPDLISYKGLLYRYDALVLGGVEREHGRGEVSA